MLQTRSILPLLLVLVYTGCAQREQIPSYPWVDKQTALRTLAERAREVKTVSAQCQLVLTRADGQSVRLDGAMAMRLPDHVRLRAWKLGQAVFDLTLTPEALWVAMPPGEQNRQRVLPASVSAAKMARTWALLSGEFFTGDQPRIVDSGGPRLRAERVIDGQRITCEIDRATLTPRRYTLVDPEGAQRFELVEDHYRQINGVPWATRLIARSDTGTVVVEMTEVELNGELPAAAFTPPRRATMNLAPQMDTDEHR